MKSRVITLALFAAACGASNTEAVATTTTTGGLINQPGSVNAPQGLRESPPMVVLGDDAASQIASVRCTQEDACGNVGPGGAFSAFDVCVKDVQLTQRVQLTGGACAKGVDPYALQACVEQMRTLECGEVAESCAGARLCR